MNPETLDRVFDLILRRPWATVALAAAVMVAMTAGVRFITVTNDYRILFGENNPELAEYEALEDTYAESNRALIAVAPVQGSAFTRETLGAIEELTEAAWQAPYSSRVDSLTNYSHSEAFGDDLTVGPLVDGAEFLSDEELAEVETIALNSVETAGRLVSRDGRVGGVVINFFLPDPMDAAVVEITDYLNALLDEARASHPDIDYYLTGDVVMHRAFADATQDDLRRLMPIVFVIIVTAAAILLRSVPGTLAIVIVLMFVVNTTLGLAGWLRTEFSPTNAGVPIIVMAMTVAYAVHIVSITLLRMSQGLNKMEAIRESFAAQRHARVPDFPDHDYRVPEPERLRFAPVPRTGQSGGVRRVLRFLFLHGAAPRGPLAAAAEGAAPARGQTALLRPPGDLRDCPTTATSCCGRSAPSRSF